MKYIASSSAFKELGILPRIHIRHGLCEEDLNFFGPFFFLVRFKGETIEIHTRPTPLKQNADSSFSSGLFKAGLFKRRMKISIFRAFIKVHRGVYEIANTLLAGEKMPTQ